MSPSKSLHPAQVLKSGHDISSSQYPGGVPPHKRMRKPIVRKSVDPNATFINYIVRRRFFPSSSSYNGMNLFSTPPHSYYKRNMLPPFVYPANDDLVSCVCTKFCRCSTNKQRCPVNCLVWTPEGRRLITGNSVGEFTLWNGLAFNFETILQAHDEAVRAMVWSHNDNWLVTADHGGMIKYWQSSMTNVQLIQGHREPVRSLSFSPTDFKFVSCSDDATIKIWDFESSREERVLTGHGWDVKCVAYHPQKSLLASGSKDNLVKIWDPKTGNSLNTLHGHKNTVFKVAWNDNGNWLCTASRDQLIKIYDIRTFKELQTMKGHAREVTSIAWHPWYERLLLSGGYDGSLIYWEVGKEQSLAVIPQAHDTAVWDIQWHPVGHVVATGSNDHSTKFWSRNRPGDPMDDKYNGGSNVLREGEQPDSVPGPFDAINDEMMMPGMADGARISIRPGTINPASFQAFSQAAQRAAFDDPNNSTSTQGTNGSGTAGGGTAGRRPPPDNYTCNRCGTKGHWIDDCPTKDQQGPKIGPDGQIIRRIPPDNYLCKRCNIPGHYISDCTQAKVPPPNYVCHKCRQKGHWKQDCPMDQGSILNFSSVTEQVAAVAGSILPTPTTTNGIGNIPATRPPGPPGPPGPPPILNGPPSRLGPPSGPPNLGPGASSGPPPPGLLGYPPPQIIHRPNTNQDLDYNQNMNGNPQEPTNIGMQESRDPRRRRMN